MSWVTVAIEEIMAILGCSRPRAKRIVLAAYREGYWR